MNPKDRSLICRMAGNIVGTLYATNTQSTEGEDICQAINIATRIVEEVDRRLIRAEKTRLEKENNPT